MQAVHGRVLLHVGLQSWQQDLKIWYGKIQYTKSTLYNVYDRPICKNLELSLYGMFFIWIGLSVNNLMTDNWISCNYELSSTMISSTNSAVTASHALQVSTSSTKTENMSSSATLKKHWLKSHHTPMPDRSALWLLCYNQYYYCANKYL